MGTRSTIALEYADGTVGQIYCHWDGYLECNGQILHNDYADPFKVRDLLDGGDTSSLDKHVSGCDFYSKRGESIEDTRQRMFMDFADYKCNAQFEEYDYILRQVDGKPVWFVRSYATYDDFIPLEKALLAEKEYVE